MRMHLAGSRWAGVYRDAGGLLGASTGAVAQRHAALRRADLYVGGRCCGRGAGGGEEAFYCAEQGRSRGSRSICRWWSAIASLEIACL